MRATCMWPTAATGASRSLTETAKYLREIQINIPNDHNIRPWMRNKSSDVPSTTEAPAPMNKTMLNGSSWAICITPGPHQVLYASDGYPGRID